jgi:hypothetical protein
LPHLPPFAIWISGLLKSVQTRFNKSLRAAISRPFNSLSGDKSKRRQSSIRARFGGEPRLASCAIRGAWLTYYLAHNSHAKVIAPISASVRSSSIKALNLLKNRSNIV